MKLFFCACWLALAGPLLRSSAQTMPLRVTSPSAGPAPLLNLAAPPGQAAPTGVAKGAAALVAEKQKDKNGQVRATSVTATRGITGQDRRAARAQQKDSLKAYWAREEWRQKYLADSLASYVLYDSLQKVHAKLRRAVSKEYSTKAVAKYQAGLRSIDSARGRVAARVAPYQARQAYARFQRRNAQRLTVMPVISRRDAPFFFNSPSAQSSAEFLDQATAVINPGTGKLSLYNELYGDYVGWWRVGIGTTLVGSNKGEATTPEAQRQEVALQRLLGGGGNLLLSAALPLAFFRTDDEVVVFRLMTTNTFAADLPQANTDASSLAYHSDLGLELTGYYRGSRRLLTPIVYLRLGRVWGNDLFYYNLAAPDNSGLTVGQVRAGLDIADVLQVAGTFYYGSAFIRAKFPFALAVTLKPKLAER